jgi:hypothetical protein
MASIDGSDPLAFDASDILDAGGRGGLLKLAVNTKTPPLRILGQWASQPDFRSGATGLLQ